MDLVQCGSGSAQRWGLWLPDPILLKLLLETYKITCIVDKGSKRVHETDIQLDIIGNTSGYRLGGGSEGGWSEVKLGHSDPAD